MAVMSLTYDDIRRMVVEGLQDEVASAITESVLTRRPCFVTVVHEQDCMMDQILTRASNDHSEWPTMTVFRGRDWSGKPWCIVVVDDDELGDAYDSVDGYNETRVQ